MSAAPPRPTLDEARAKLRELGYLRGGVERFVFRRALEKASGHFAPVLLAVAVALALAQTSAVASSQFRYGGYGRASVLLFLQLCAVGVLPSALFAAVLTGVAGRSRHPGAGATAFGLFAAVAVLSTWIVGTWRLGPAGAAPALLWGILVCLAAILAGGTARAAFLALAFTRSGRLPERRRRAILLSAAAAALSIAAVAYALHGEPALPVAPLPSPRTGALVVLAIDGLRLDSRGGEDEKAISALLARGATGWWEARHSSPAEMWTDLATGVSAARHGVRALEWVRPFRLPALRPPFGTSWYFRGVGLALGTVSRSPVSASERRSLAFWEVTASAGLPSLAVGWWASGPWPNATVVENREVLARAASGGDADVVATAEFERRAEGKALKTVYLPGADILRDQPSARRVVLFRIASLLERLISRARRGQIALVVLAADSHPVTGSLGRIVVFDGSAFPSRMVRIAPEDVAPSLLARAGVPPARDLPGRPAVSLFAPGSLETAGVPTYGERIAPEAPAPKETDREYLEKLKSLGYLN